MITDLTTLNLSNTVAATIVAVTGIAVAFWRRKARKSARPSLAGVAATIIGLYLIEYGHYRDKLRGRLALGKRGWFPIITDTTTRHNVLASAAACQPATKLVTPQLDHLSETEAIELVAALRGPNSGAGCHMVDDIAAHFLTTIGRADAIWLKANFDAKRQGWPTASLLIEMLAQRTATRD